MKSAFYTNKINRNTTKNKMEKFLFCSIDLYSWCVNETEEFRKYRASERVTVSGIF